MNARALWYFTPLAAYPPWVSQCQACVRWLRQWISLRWRALSLIYWTLSALSPWPRCRDGWGLEWAWTNSSFHCWHRLPNTAPCLCAVFYCRAAALGNRHRSSPSPAGLGCSLRLLESTLGQDLLQSRRTKMLSVRSFPPVAPQWHRQQSPAGWWANSGRLLPQWGHSLHLAKKSWLKELVGGEGVDESSCLAFIRIRVSGLVILYRLCRDRLHSPVFPWRLLYR